MKRNILSAILCGALVGFSSYAFADTTEAGGNAPAWNRGGRGGSAVMVIECDQPVFDRAVEEISALPGILRVTRYTPEQEAQI
jgi:hypothetical protein